MKLPSTKIIDTTNSHSIKFRLAEPRSKRAKIDRHGRSAAFEKLRGLKGSKHKANIADEVDNVYDTIDEREYEKRVLARADEDWIEDGKRTPHTQTDRQTEVRLLVFSYVGLFFLFGFGSFY